LAAAAQLNPVGHAVTVFEKDDRLGGLLRYGIPDFKLEKWVIDRRIELLTQEGVDFRTGVHVGVDFTVDQLRAEYDALLLAVGATVPRDLPIPGREARGVMYAMEYLTEHNRFVAGDEFAPKTRIDAKDKHVIVIGGGDTGSDCVGTANRQGAQSVTQLQYRPAPGKDRPAGNFWPDEPMIFSATSSHEEGCDRQWSILTKGFTVSNGEVTGLKVVELDWIDPATRNFKEKPGTETVLPCDYAMIAIGYQHPDPVGLLKDVNAPLNNWGMVEVDPNMRTSIPGLFAAGDAQRGQSLVVWALADGRKAARSIDEYLMGESHLVQNEMSAVVISE
ncbi:MAG TPA: glutamate synthase, partial [Cytophagales bacterium]|nr:glutamate synthase [Cytophagales bacterium]